MLAALGRRDAQEEVRRHLRGDAVHQGARARSPNLHPRPSPEPEPLALTPHLTLHPRPSPEPEPLALTPHLTPELTLTKALEEIRKFKNQKKQEEKNPNP